MNYPFNLEMYLHLMTSCLTDFHYHVILSYIQYLYRACVKIEKMFIFFWNLYISFDYLHSCLELFIPFHVHLNNYKKGFLCPWHFGAFSSTGVGLSTNGGGNLTRRELSYEKCRVIKTKTFGNLILSSYCKKLQFSLKHPWKCRNDTKLMFYTKTK